MGGSPLNFPWTLGGQGGGGQFFFNFFLGGQAYMGGSPHPPPVGKTLPDTDWTTLDGGLNKTFYYKDNPSPQKRKQKTGTINKNKTRQHQDKFSRDCHQ